MLGAFIELTLSLAKAGITLNKERHQCLDRKAAVIDNLRLQ